MKLLLLFAWSFLASSSDDPGIDKKIMDQLASQFPHASDVKWYADGSNYTCYFKIESQVCVMKYNSSGELLSSRRTLPVNYLPPTMANKISTRYKASVYGVTELTEGDSAIYEIVLQTSAKWIIVQADLFGNTELVRSFRKG